MSFSHPFWIGLTVSWLLTSAAGGAETRLWKDVSGKFSVRAELVDFDASEVRLRLADGAVISVPIAKLSGYDRLHLQRAGAQAAKVPPRAEVGNPAASQPLASPTRVPPSPSADSGQKLQPSGVASRQSISRDPSAGDDPAKPSRRQAGTRRPTVRKSGTGAAQVVHFTAQPMRKWELRLSNKVIEGSLKTVTAGEVTVETEDQQLVTIPLTKLSFPDRAHIGMVSGGAMYRPAHDWTKRLNGFGVENPLLKRRAKPSPRGTQPPAKSETPAKNAKPK